jgi:nucleoside-diphosphate-sugar epimerase
VTDYKALVVGATGVTGAPICEQLLRSGWPVCAISRRAPALNGSTAGHRLTHLALDLTDGDAMRAALLTHGDITHVFYCANAATQELRQSMIGQLLDVLEPMPRFANINFIQGMKYYGCHLGPFHTPARETDPRVPGCDFYYSEEDMLIRRQAGRTWSWTTLRPHSVCGYSIANPLNVGVALALYGSIQKERNAEFAFPGSETSFNTLFQVVDADLLARAAIHVSTTSACRNQAFNINNGDIFRWSDLWPALGAFFALSSAPPLNITATEFFRHEESTWHAMAQKYKLKPFPYERLPKWCQGEYTPPNGRLNCTHDIFANTTRLRQSGFAEFLDSQDMFLKLFGELSRQDVIP